MSDQLTPSAEKRPHHYRLAWGAVIALLMLYTYWQLMRVEQGHLFALPLPGERDPTAAELEDARRSAQSFLYPAMIAVLALGVVFASVVSRLQLPLGKPSRGRTAVLALFFIAALADLITTLHFFHHQGVNYELHPGIRLFGYAYGLTIGPLAGKLLQALGILTLSVVAGRFGMLLLIAVAVTYGLAAIYNVIQITI